MTHLSQCRLCVLADGVQAKAALTELLLKV